jgi:NAD(P)-dependent dehydrogenase (short-subunit alcohol dehydrogenase family)
MCAPTGLLPATGVVLLLVALFLLVQRFWLHPLPRRRILISGCDSGIGQAAALELARRGATVFAGCLTAEGCEQLAHDFAATAASSNSISNPSVPSPPPGILHPFCLDVTSDVSVAAAAELVRSVGDGTLDVLLNNAGIMAPASLVSLTPLSSYARNFDVNTLGALRMIQACLPLLRRSATRGRDRVGARIVNVTSFLGHVAPFSLSAYSASKFALEALTQSLRAELRSQSIQVVVLQPGTTRTKLGGMMSTGMERCWAEATEAQREELGPTYLRAMQRSNWMLGALNNHSASWQHTLLSFRILAHSYCSCAFLFRLARPRCVQSPSRCDARSLRSLAQGRLCQHFPAGSFVFLSSHCSHCALCLPS